VVTGAGIVVEEPAGTGKLVEVVTGAGIMVEEPAGTGKVVVSVIGTGGGKEFGFLAGLNEGCRVAVGGRVVPDEIGGMGVNKGLLVAGIKCGQFGRVGVIVGTILRQGVSFPPGLLE
jgi:hypothetical protein